MSETDDRLEHRVEELEARLQRAEAVSAHVIQSRCIRRKSETTIFGAPLLHIALGPDLLAGERMGHARGVIAIGDDAVGFLAIGGIARGVVCLGGLALGLFSTGGLSVGLLVALGGMAIGYVACGGVAIGYFAFGGLAIGHLAVGGASFGESVINASRRDPEAIKMLERFLPLWIQQWIPFLNG